MLLYNIYTGCGYNVTWHVIDAAHFVPQSRERLYMVGFREDLGIVDGINWTIGLTGDVDAGSVEKDGANSDSNGCNSSGISVGPGWTSVVRDILEPQYEATVNYRHNNIDGEVLHFTFHSSLHVCLTLCVSLHLTLLIATTNITIHNVPCMLFYVVCISF
jgi:site-specific DNA-cytosine methylase